uniref:Uncharacterized protein n=1 Tax=Zooxanthella nutricula TaxID=1333877 RepID=A0A6U6K3U5_9DINO|mmetsp:Transcript_25932/g.78053  ORF Transcript_25932/g.78053 Transcript_25932/m.78053 type:complete len:588 (+) Transcript_25932:116-1879(+)|eukprot:CAMPEP_0198525798 /NCGR_PEP_ID=MMETSP1462-20131121/23571_1 /TAXON_ID=1333877 /ORGANISM="Brandtodinium nutriculum, Strain RCC3387" /LENGTH=587 /DNA_ID=CAMNT_0044255555 /DNA_START=40 /DNA_END=1803 /DNA_ORIENTATION=-
MAAAWKEGSTKLYREIYQETGSGDFGIQIAGGPLFRCHTHILQQSGGFIGKVRQFGKVLPREVDSYEVPAPKEYFKEHGYMHLMADLQAIQFSQPIERSALTDPMKKLTQQPDDPNKPGYTTAHFIGGTTCAMKRLDPFFLAERYKVECDCERMAELLRFVYQGQMSFFDQRPETDRERGILTDKMLHMAFDAERYSVDRLYEKLLHWFGHECYPIIGEKCFAESFYHLQHFEVQVTEEFSRQMLIRTVTGDMLATREQFRAVTRDPRWGSLPVDFVEDTLNYDGMPIGSETEVLSLIERWNANADKKKEHIIRLLCCFRPSDETKHTFCTWLVNMGWLRQDGTVPDVPELQGLRRIVDGSAVRGKKPRQNLTPVAMLQNDEEDAANQEAKDVVFLHMKGSQAVASGCSFSVGAQQRLVQADPIRYSGIQRMRVVLSNPKVHLWNPEHEVFVGMSYGEGKYFGYLCSATAFSGIFSVRALASAAPAPNAPQHLTGSGNKVEFDLGLEVQVQRANMVVVCKLSVIFANLTVTEEAFQISYETLAFGPGLRFQVVATGLGDDEVDVQLAWVGGGGPPDEIELNGPLDFE